MKVCSIYNTFDRAKNPIAFLLYYEKEDYFHIRICETGDKENMPFMFTLFAEKGIYSIGSEWSRRWVQSRIIPPDRQNLGAILRDNGMESYDEYTFLVKSKGKCSHDDFAVEEISVKKYMEYEAEEIVMKDIVSDGNDFLVFFNNGETRKYSAKEFELPQPQERYLEAHGADYRIMPGGFEINWNDVVIMDVEYLKSKGHSENISYQYFENFVRNNVMGTAQVCEQLNCSRQNVDELVNRERLHPLQSYAKNKIFLKSEVDAYHKK